MDSDVTNKVGEGKSKYQVKQQFTITEAALKFNKDQYQFLFNKEIYVHKHFHNFYKWYTKNFDSDKLSPLRMMESRVGSNVAVDVML